MTDIDPMAEIQASFFIECDELLEALQDGLNVIDEGTFDDETINVCFRAVHSMKGGAGAFGLEDLVRFAHRYETALDEVRKGNLTPGHEESLLFMRAADVLSDIVHASREGGTLDEAAVEPTLRDLEALAGGPQEEEEEECDFQPLGLALDLPADDDAPSRFEIVFAPEPELFKSGNEPVHLIRALGDLGDLSVRCDLGDAPDLAELDPDSAWISWHITLETDAQESDIAEAFEFVEGICTLEIVKESPSVPSLISISGLPDLPELPDLPTIDAAELPPPVATKDTVSRLTLSLPGTSTESEQPTTSDEAPVATSPQPVSATPEPAPRPKPKQSPPTAAQPKATVRVDLERIDRLVNLVGELVINQAMLSQSLAGAGLPANSPVAQGLEEFMQLTRDIQDSVMMIRAQPVKSLFQRMGRIVRESSSAVGKRVRLVTDGETTEVDKTVIERLADPLTHMIRNAVDHGLEPADLRESSGKPLEGAITLCAAHRSGRVIIEISDDGRGIDRAKVRSIAEEKGLISPDQQLSDAEIDELLFLPGFSTAKQVSDLSGRGVGMDVVRKAIQDLGGRVTISSTPGVGTCFSISLPLTLAVLDGMVVNVAGETLVVPLGSIVETLTLRNDDIRTLGPQTQVLSLRDTFVPLLDLGTELGYRPPQNDYNGHVVLLITKDDGAKAALIVDTIHEQRQVVIKGLQESYGYVPGIAAATILGDGQIALILDPIDLMANAIGCTRVPSDLLKQAG